jgi:predicted amidohydrolase YtcJ
VATLAWASTAPAGAQALSREEALVAYTRGGAFAEFAERDKGWLGPGALADLAVLADDPFAADPGRLAALRSVLTVVGGRVAFDAGVLRLSEPAAAGPSRTPPARGRRQP